MYSLVDLILLKDRTLKRSDVEHILTLTGDTIKEQVEQGTTVAWIGLCTFTYKKKATSKKQEKEWEANPELAEGDKVRVLTETEGLTVKGDVLKLKKAARVKTQEA